ncbi:MAG TPA: efflux RND transporter periplasmic adaptor subunit [Rhodocyclaceae bacterium]|nr:efflux RND transporter periplasmic adaptor subunit [Rhodocyclaceae bacterium]
MSNTWAISAPSVSTSNSIAPATRSIAANERQALDKQDIRAQLSPRRFTTLASEISAKINRISVKEGDRFKAGQVLISLDCEMQTAQLQRAQASLDAAEKIYAANKRLADLNSVGKLELDTSQAEVAKSRADVSLIDTTLHKCNITAPFSGRVAEQKMREQQYVQAGQPILDILDDSTLELEFIVPSRWLVWLKSGYKFQVKIDETDASYPARITRLGARIDPVSQSIKVAAVIDGQFSDLIAGMSGRIELTPP